MAEPCDFLSACRMGVFTDPEGAAFAVWEAREHKGARLINDPGAVVFHNLNTRDVDGAKSFYGSDSAGRRRVSAATPTDGLCPRTATGSNVSTTPGLRQQMADAGAPERFEDVVGSIIPIPEDQPDTPPHWSVTFATADAEATAAKASELGRRVIVPPFDAPWSTDTYSIRITVICDPPGATFTASKFVSKSRYPGS